MVEETKKLYELYEKRLTELLEDLETMNPCHQDYQATVDAINILSDKLAAFEKNAMDREDKSERRRIEEDRNKAQERIETEKQHLGWKRVTFEMSKILAPVLTGGVIFGLIHERNMELEEEGRISTTTGRCLANLASRFFKM